MSENEDKEVERRVGYDRLETKIDNIGVRVEKLSDGFDIFKEEWIQYQIACAKDNLADRVSWLESKPEKTIKGWETKLNIVLIIVTLIVSSMALYSSFHNGTTIQQQDANFLNKGK